MSYANFRKAFEAERRASGAANGRGEVRAEQLS